MSFRKRLLLLVVILLGAGGLGAFLAPFVVAQGVRTWLRWAAPSENVSIECGKIEAPFLRPVTIEQLLLAPAGANADTRSPYGPSGWSLILIFAAGLSADKRACFARSRSISLTGSVRQGNQRGGKKLNWRNLERLLPDRFRIVNADFEVATAATSFVFRGVNLSASEVESGRFSARQIAVASPILRQTFRDLRGATSWETNRLSIAGVSLARGLDLESLTIDLSRLTNRRVGLDFQVDAFGGLLRGSFQGRGGGKKFSVDLTGSASNISLAQVSAAAGFVEPLTGAVRTSQFTFRGNPGEFLDATASIWIELSDFAWRARRGDHLVFGATYYNRRLQVEQLYVEQRPNELTVNGELFWPKRLTGWSALSFRGQLNATIPDANSFAQLFGAAPGDFSGALSASGQIDALEPGAHGKLNFRGNGMRFRGVTLDSLGGELRLDGTEANLTKLEVRHENDFLRAHGTMNLAAPHAYSARLTGAINDLAAYAPLLPKSWQKGQVNGGITFDWSGDGTRSANSGTVQLFAHGLQLPVVTLRAPLDVTLEGTYSPQEAFFRTFKLADDRVSLGGFLLLGSDFIELQALTLTLDGVPRANGTLFLPVGVDRWRKTNSLLEALSEKQKFDVDLALDHLDLAEFARAVGETAPINGVLDGKLAAYGSLPALQVTTSWRLENFGPAPQTNKTKLDLHYADGQLDGTLRATFGSSAPLLAQVLLPLRLEKSRLRNGLLLDPTRPLSVSLNFPALFSATMPEKLRPLGSKSGIVSGMVQFSNTLREPQIQGAAQLLDLDPSLPTLWPRLTKLSAELQFTSHAVEIPHLHFETNEQTFRWNGRLTLRPPFYTLTLSPAAGGSIAVSYPDAEAANAPLRDAILHGTLGSPKFSLTTNDRREWTVTRKFDLQKPLTPGPILRHVSSESNAGPAIRLRVSDTQTRWP